jgi:hypothetical protein
VHVSYSTENLSELYGADPDQLELELGGIWLNMDVETASRLMRRSEC